MKRVTRCALPMAALLCAAAPGAAQLGELHIGAVVSHGVQNVYGTGAGVVVGVAAGRLTYLGLRAIYQAGSTDHAGSATAPVDVTNRAVVLAADLGFQLPAGAFEIVPGISLGAVRFQQRGRLPAGEPPPARLRNYAAPFLAAPSLSVQARWAGLLIIPEIQYYLVNEPEMTWPVEQRGPVFSLRLVVPIEVGRVRH